MWYFIFPQDYTCSARVACVTCLWTVHARIFAENWICPSGDPHPRTFESGGGYRLVEITSVLRVGLLSANPSSNQNDCGINGCTSYYILTLTFEEDDRRVRRGQYSARYVSTRRGWSSAVLPHSGHLVYRNSIGRDVIEIDFLLQLGRSYANAWITTFSAWESGPAFFLAFQKTIKPWIQGFERSGWECVRSAIGLSCSDGNGKISLDFPEMKHH